MPILEPMVTPRSISGGAVLPTPQGWRLEIPAGEKGTYRLAQLDDYFQCRRRSFPHTPPLTLKLRARLSAPTLPGTWGFGLWNDPFGLSLGFGGQAARLPALPNAAWFFYASAENYLSFGHAPGNGFFAGTFRSPLLPSFLFAPVILALPLLLLRPLSRLARSLAGRLIRQDGKFLEVDVTAWHEYGLTWEEAAVTFSLDNRRILFTPISPNPPLGLVIWIDNQYAAWTPRGCLRYGTLANPPAWMEISDLIVE